MNITFFPMFHTPFCVPEHYGCEKLPHLGLKISPQSACIRAKFNTISFSCHSSYILVIKAHLFDNFSRLQHAVPLSRRYSTYSRRYSTYSRRYSTYFHAMPMVPPFQRVIPICNAMLPTSQRI
jgi:hypothetical protein